MPWRLERLWALQAEAGWSDSDLARCLGVSRMTVKRVKAGLTSPSARFQEQVLRTFPQAAGHTLVWYELEEEA